MLTIFALLQETEDAAASSGSSMAIAGSDSVRRTSTSPRKRRACG